MDLVAELEREPSKNQLNRVIRFVGNNPARFSQLMALFLQGPYRLTQRAAKPLIYCAEQNPELVKPYLNQLLKIVSHQDVAVSIRRNIVRLLQFVDIPGNLQAKAISICFGLLTDPKETIAVKVFSMTVISNLERQHPPLAKELVSILESQLPYASAAYRSRAKRIMARHKL